MNGWVWWTNGCVWWMNEWMCLVDEWMDWVWWMNGCVWWMNKWMCLVDGWMGSVDEWMCLVDEWMDGFGGWMAKHMCMFSHNLPPALQAERPASFTCNCGAVCFADGLLRLRQCRRLQGAAVQQLGLGRGPAPQTAPPGRHPPLPRRRVPPLPGPVLGAGAVVASLGHRCASQKPSGLLPRAVHDRRQSRVCDGFCCFC